MTRVNQDLVLPIIGGDGNPGLELSDRTPHRFTTLQFVQLFATNPHRVTLCRCFFAHRARLQELGGGNGFQWVSGSFVDLARPDPRDVDVVTFYYESDVRGDGASLVGEEGKLRFNVDAYTIDLGLSSELVVDWAVYWYELWTSRRTGGRKGFVRLDLCEDGGEALSFLDECQRQVT